MRYTLIDSDRVFVVLDDALVALDASDGAELWQQPAGNATLMGATVSGAEVVDVDSNGLVRAFSANNGLRMWSRQLPQGRTAAPPTSANGVVYVTDSQDGGDLYALNAGTSAVLWKANVTNGDDSAPSVADGVVITDYSCDDTSAVSTNDGSSDWSLQGCSGGDGATVPIHDGVAWLRDRLFNDQSPERAVNDRTGETVTTTNSQGLAAFAGTTRFLDAGAVSASSESLPDVPLWTSLAPDYTSPPLTFDGLVAVIGDNSRVDLLNQKTGVLTYSSGLLSNPQDSDDSEPSYLAVGDGLLTAPIGNDLVAFASQTQGPPPSPVAPAQPAVPAAEQITPAGSDAWTGIGGSPTHNGDSGDGFTATMAQVWRQDLGQPIGQALILPSLTVVPVLDPDNKNADIYGLDAATGHILWGPVVLTEAEIGVTMSVTDGVIVVGGSGYTGDWGLSAATGDVLWGVQGYGSDAPQTDDAGHFYDRGAEYNALSGAVIAGSAQGNQSAPLAITGNTIFANDATGGAGRDDNGTITWSGRCSGVMSSTLMPPDYLGATLILPGLGTPSAVLDASSGACLHELETPAQTGPQAAQDAANAVVIESDDVVDLNPSSGDVNWRTSLASPPTNQVIVGQNQILVPTNDNELVVLDRATGSVLGATPVAGRLYNGLASAVAAAQGLVIAPTTTGFIAFNDGTPAGVSSPPTSTPTPSLASPTPAMPTPSLASPTPAMPTPSLASTPTSSASPAGMAPSPTAPTGTPAPMTSSPSSLPSPGPTPSQPSRPSASPTHPIISATPSMAGSAASLAAAPPSNKALPTVSRGVTTLGPMASVPPTTSLPLPSSATPEAPQRVSVTALAHAVSISWRPAADATAGTSYLITAEPGGHLISTTKFHATITGLRNGVSLVITVSARHANLRSGQVALLARAGVSWRTVSLKTHRSSTREQVSFQLPQAERTITIDLSVATPSGWRIVRRLTETKQRWTTTANARPGEIFEVVIPADATHTATVLHLRLRP